jgi:hypothetical protein
MSISGLNYTDVTKFRGPMLQPQAEVSDIPTDASLRAENVSYLPGRVQTREGHEQVFSGYQPRSMSNWTTQTGNWLLSLTPSSVIRRDIGNGGELTLGSITADRGSFAQAGNKVYMSFRNTSGVSAGEARVWDGNAFAKIAPPPLAYVPTITQPAVGGITAGKHRIAYIVSSLSGYVGKPGPVVGGVFSPVEFTADGNKRIHFSITLNTPSWAANIYVLMTTTADLEKYFYVPGAVIGIPANATGWTVGIDIDCSDERLELVDQEATDQFFLATQDAAGNGPISPSHCFAYSNRMVYLCGQDTYISDQGNYEALALDRNLINLPNGKPMTSGGEVRGTCYLVGPSYTYSIQDTNTGDAPTTWPTPVQVSGSIGTPAALGFAVNSDYGFAWVAAEGGLYCFDGQYPELPVSYWQSPVWQRINWAKAHLIEVVDHTPSQRVFVMVPLDGATVPTHILTFDYQDGRTFDTIKFSLDNITGINLSCLALVRSATTGRLDLWMSCTSAGGSVIRRFSRDEMSTSPGTRYNDMTAPIPQVFKAAVVPEVASQTTLQLQHRAAKFRVQGNGTLNITAKTLDDVKQASLNAITLSTAPGKHIQKRFHLIGTALAYEFTMPSVANTYFILSGFRHYFSKFL